MRGDACGPTSAARLTPLLIVAAKRRWVIKPRIHEQRARSDKEKTARMVRETHRPVLSSRSLNCADNAVQRERVWIEVRTDAGLQRDNTDTRYRSGEGILHRRGEQHIAKRGHTLKGAPAELKNESEDGHK